MENKKDILQRQEFINQLINIVSRVSSSKSSCCFAINGKWGSGKTYVLDNFESQLEKTPDENNVDSKYLVFHYNCWEFDYYEEPSIAIVASMLNKIEREESYFGELDDDVIKSVSEKAKQIVLKIAGEFAKNKIGVDLVDLVQSVNRETATIKDKKNQFDNMFAFRKTLDSTRQSLTELAKDKTIVFVVDELDRCLPAYAIKVLERLHHICEEVQNIAVVLAVDSEQLNYSVQQIYGANTDIDSYLKKFIDFTLNLDFGTVSNDFEENYRGFIDLFNLKENDREFLRIMFQNLVKGLDIRTQEKIMFMVKLIHEIVADGKIADPSLLCYEIMWSVLYYRTNYADMEWVLTAHNQTWARDTDVVKEIRKYIQESLTSVGKWTGRTTNERRIREINDDIKDRTFWIFSRVYPSTNNSVYYVLLDNKNANKLQSEIDIAKRFTELAKLMIK